MEQRIFTFAEYSCLVLCPTEWAQVLDKYYPTFISAFSKKVRTHFTFIISQKVSKSSLKDSLTFDINPKERILSLTTTFDPFTAFPMIDRGFKKIFTYIFWLNEGFVIHASAIAYKKSAYIFIGKSGSGKSTTVRNCQFELNVDVLSDNEIFVKSLSGSTYCYANPFIELSNYRRSPQLIHNFKLKGIVQLEKSKDEKLTRLPYSMFLTNNNIDIFAPSWENEGEIKARIINKLFLIDSSVQIFNFSFTKKTNFIKVLDASK